MSVPPPDTSLAGESVGGGAISAWLAWLLLAAVVVSWGISWPILNRGVLLIEPLWIAMARFATGAACLFAFLALRRIPIAWPHGDGRILCWLAATQMVAYNALGISGLLFLDSARAVVLAFTTPLWVAPLALVFLGERIRLLAGIGILIGLAGLAVLFNPAGFDWSDRNTLIGNALILGAALSYAVSIILTRGYRWRSALLLTAPWQMLIAAAMLTPLALAIEGTPDIVWSGMTWFVLAYVGPLATGFGYWAILAATARLPAASTALGLMAVPVVGVGTAAAVFGEPVTPMLLAGLVLLLAGIGLGIAATRRG